MNKKQNKFKLSTTHILMLSFLLLIIIGTCLLILPISSKSNQPIKFIDALFTSTTATCVTGLVTVPTVSTWSIFGQVVILFLIQIGGLGVITAITWILILLNKKLGISDELLLQDTLNLNTMSGLNKFIKKVIKGTLIIEGIGALCYMTVFIPEFGIRGIWISIFTSVSAFCNAGIDIISDMSLSNYLNNPIINLTTCSLIILSGLGYVVWWDIIKLVKNKQKLKFRNLTLHSKIVLSTTFILIIVGTVLIFLFEYGNPSTLQNLSLFNKLQASLFQSVTTRTAGFFTIPQENFTNASSLLCLLLMFIGGSPVGTAGGVKTVTIVVLFAVAFATIKNKEQTTLFNRAISRQTIRKSITVICMSFVTVFVSTILLSLTTNANLLDIIYETVSAGATVGLSRNLTSSLDTIGKIIIIITMYLGSLGENPRYFNAEMNRPVFQYR